MASAALPIIHDGGLCIAAPIRNGKGVVEAGVSTSGPSAELEAYDNLERFIVLARAVAESSTHLGWRG